MSIIQQDIERTKAGDRFIGGSRRVWTVLDTKFAPLPRGGPCIHQCQVRNTSSERNQPFYVHLDSNTQSLTFNKIVNEEGREESDLNDSAAQSEPKRYVKLSS